MALKANKLYNFIKHNIVMTFFYDTLKKNTSVIMTLQKDTSVIHKYIIYNVVMPLMTLMTLIF